MIYSSHHLAAFWRRYFRERISVRPVGALIRLMRFIFFFNQIWASFREGIWQKEPIFRQINVSSFLRRFKETAEGRCTGRKGSLVLNLLPLPHELSYAITQITCRIDVHCLVRFTAFVALVVQFFVHFVSTAFCLNF